ncbi:17723_t:CDS:1, partial [Gigaspora rosea]
EESVRYYKLGYELGNAHCAEVLLSMMENDFLDQNLEYKKELEKFIKLSKISKLDDGSYNGINRAFIQKIIDDYEIKRKFEDVLNTTDLRKFVIASKKEQAENEFENKFDYDLLAVNDYVN